MKTYSLAARNLLRNRRRSVATLLALAIGAASVLLFGGYSKDIHYSLITGYVQTGGHLQVQHKDFYQFGSGNPTAYGIANYQRLIQAIQQDTELKGTMRVVSPMLQFGGLAGNYEAGVSRTVFGLGYVADDVSRMRQWNEYKLPGAEATFGLHKAPEGAVIVGEGLARVLLLCDRLGMKDCPRPQVDVKPATGAALPADIADLASSLGTAETTAKAAGANIELLATQPKGSPNVASVKVIAAENQGLKEFDEVTVLLHMSQAQRLVYGKADQRATAIMVQLEHTSDMKAVKTRIEKLIADVAPTQPLAVLDYQQLNPFFQETVNLFNTIFGFIFVLIAAIVLFTVSNTMMAAVTERTSEIGTIRAVGLRQGGVRKLFLVEGFLIGCAGALVGVLLAIAASELVNHLDLTWLPPGSSHPLPLSIRVLGEYKTMVLTTAGLIGIATLSAWLPAWRAARLSIVDALRHA